MDLTTDSSLLVDISDALSEKDKVKFTVHTKVCEFLGNYCQEVMLQRFKFDEYGTYHTQSREDK